MTDFKTLAEAIERDRADGTPGPWRACETTIHGRKYGGCWVEGPEIDEGDGRPHGMLIPISGSHGSTSYTQRVVDVQIHDHNDANARRIARLPELETAYLELWARVQEWQPIDTAPGYGVPHTRGLWVHRAKTGERLHWQADTGFINEEGNFIGWGDCDFGWNAEDYTHWMPLPQPPEATNDHD